jgi:uncharacterized protein GlcG (DUF336 family)
MKITLELAKKIIEAAKKKAKEMGIPVCIAVVDEGGNLVAFERMDGAGYGGINIAIDKAYTAAAFGWPTDEIGKVAQPGGFAFGIANADRGRIMIFAGGIPLKSGNEIIGGIGVSGGTAPDDKKIAEAGAKVIEK